MTSVAETSGNALRLAGARSLSIAALVLFVLPASAAQVSIPSTWTSSHHRDHPLVGRLFTGAGEAMTGEALAARIAAADHVLLGEQHDNPDHHLFQAHLLGVIGETWSAKPSVVFEMVTMPFQPVLDSPKASDLGERLDWAKSGWPDWAIYRPVFEAAVTAGMPLVAGSLDREEVRAVAKEGAASLGAERLERYGMSAALEAAQRDDLAVELKEAHCGFLPETAVPSMMNVQRLRDGVMADAMLSSRAGKAVLIAGNGHVRRDRAVPHVLRLRGVDKARVLVVGMVEVRPGAEAFSDYSLVGSGGAPLYDAVLFTPKFDVTDHCAVLKERMKGKGGG